MRALRWLLGRWTAWRRLGAPWRKALPPPRTADDLASELAAQLPIFDHRTEPSGEMSLRGRSESGEFRLVYSPAAPLGTRGAETLVEVRPEEPPLPEAFSLFPRALTGGAPDPDSAVRTGDRLFDRRWVVEGESKSVLAAMNGETRTMIGRSGHLSVQRGRLYMVVDGLNTDAGAAFDQVQHATVLARRLAEGLVWPVDASRFLANLRDEPNGHVRLQLTEVLLREHQETESIEQLVDLWLGQFRSERRTQVRLRILELFMAHLPEHQGTKTLIERGLLDPSPDVRLLAARHSPSEGLAVMREVATTRFAGDETRIDALFLLGQRLAEDEFREILILCAREAATRLRRYALRRLLDDPRPSLSDDLVRVAKGSDREAAVELAELLSQAPGHIAEPALLQLLTNRSTAVKRAAAVSLGDVGSVEAVPALLALASPIIFDGSLRDVARSAILQIQYRIRAGDVGGLSLVETGDQAGALSPADSEIGALSIRPSVPRDA